MQLRESTRKALQASWDEVETLQHKNTLQKATIAKREAELVKLKEELSGAETRERDITNRNDKLLLKLTAATDAPATNAPFYKSVFTRSPSMNTFSKPRQNQGYIDRPGDDADKDQEQARDMVDSLMHTNSPPQTLLQKKSRQVSIGDLTKGSHPIAHRRHSASVQVLNRPTPSTNTLNSSWNDTRGMKNSSFVVLEKSPKIPAVDAKDLLIRDLRSKLAVRDVAIASMEEIMMENIKNMQQQQLHMNQR